MYKDKVDTSYTLLWYKGSKKSKLKCKKGNKKKTNSRIIKIPHAYLQTIVYAPIKFQKDRPKTVR